MIRIIPLVLSLFLTASCSNGEEEQPVNQTSCLSAWVTTPCELISVATFAEISGADVEAIEVDEPEEIPIEEVTQYSRIFCEYRWPSDRVSTLTIEVGGNEIENEIPLDNVVSIGDIEVIKEDDLLTLGGNTESYSDYFHRVRIGDENPEAELEGIGDMASVQIIEAMNHSNYNMTNVWVLHGDVNFNIIVDVSDDDAEDLELAKKLARAVLAKCDN